MKPLPLIFTTIIASMLLLTSCEKDPIDTRLPDDDHQTENVTDERVILYSVNNHDSRLVVGTEAEWDALLDRLCDSARINGEVAFFNINSTAHPLTKSKSLSKDSRTITTSSQQEIKQWMKRMEQEGLTVKVTYDDNTGTWSGVAYATSPSNVTTDAILGTWHFNCVVVTELDSYGSVTSSDLYAPEENGGSMYYTFNANGTVTLTLNSVDGTTSSETGTWSLSDNGVLTCPLLPNSSEWNVNWITASTLIISWVMAGDQNGSVIYQIQFDAGN